MNAMEFDIKEAQLQAALPRIVSIAGATNGGRATPPPAVVVLDTPLKAPEKQEKEIIVLDTPLKIEAPEEIPLADVQIKQELTEEKPTLGQEDQVLCKVEPNEVNENALAVAKPTLKGTPVKPRPGVIKVKTDEQLMSPNPAQAEQLPVNPNRKGTPVKIKMEDVEEDESQIIPAKPQLKGTPVKIKDEAIDTSIVEAKPLRKGTPVRAKSSEMNQTCQPGQVRSILAKKRDLFTEDSNKNVQFSSSDPIVHNLSPDVFSPPTCSKENEKPVEQDIKPVKKTQNIIRRIVVVPKKATLALK